MRRKKESESVERSIISFFFTFFLKLLELVLLGDDERRRLLLLLLEGHSSLLKLRRSKNRRRWNDREKRKSTGAINFSESQSRFFSFPLTLTLFLSPFVGGVSDSTLSLHDKRLRCFISRTALSLRSPPSHALGRASERARGDRQRGEQRLFFLSLFFSLSSSSKENEWNASASASVSPESLTRPTQAEREPS